MDLEQRQERALSIMRTGFRLVWPATLLGFIGLLAPALGIAVDLGITLFATGIALFLLATALVWAGSDRAFELEQQIDVRELSRGPRAYRQP